MKACVLCVPCGSIKATLRCYTFIRDAIIGNYEEQFWLSRNISMRTSTNFFLFSLAVADIAILLMGELIIVKNLLLGPAQKCC